MSNFSLYLHRRRQLAQLGSASGVWKTLVKYLVGCPQVHLALHLSKYFRWRMHQLLKMSTKYWINKDNSFTATISPSKLVLLDDRYYWISFVKSTMTMGRHAHVSQSLYIMSCSVPFVNVYLQFSIDFKWAEEMVFRRPMEEQRERYGPSLYKLTTFAVAIRIYLEVWWSAFDSEDL